MQPTLSVVIVNYNTADILCGCLDSILQQQAEIREVIVVDNASGDNSVELVRAKYPQVHLIANTENRGFSKANNQATGNCTADLLHFLNPDTVVRPGCFQAIRTYMAAHSEIGLAGTAIVNPDNSHHPSIEYDYPGVHYTRDEVSGLPGDIAWLLGASIVARAEVMDRVHGFDERFFLYGEDIDLCLTVRQQEWMLGYIADAQVMHIEGQSERKTPVSTVIERKIRSELIFFNKHYTRQTIARIKRARHIQACWRVVSLKLTMLFVQDRSRAEEKLIKYRAAMRLYR